MPQYIKAIHDLQRRRIPDHPTPHLSPQRPRESNQHIQGSFNLRPSLPSPQLFSLSLVLPNPLQNPHCKPPPSITNQPKSISSCTTLSCLRFQLHPLSSSRHGSTDPQEAVRTRYLGIPRYWRMAHLTILRTLQMRTIPQKTGILGNYNIRTAAPSSKSHPATAIFTYSYACIFNLSNQLPHQSHSSPNSNWCPHTSKGVHAVERRSAIQPMLTHNTWITATFMCGCGRNTHVQRNYKPRHREKHAV